MEQLPRDALRQLLERAAAIETRSDAGAVPGAGLWIRKGTSPDSQPRQTDSRAGARGAPDAVVPSPIPAGLERRLVRRAEALWNRLCAADGLPAADKATALPQADKAAALLEPPFASRAMLVRFATRPAAGSPNPQASISHVGDALPALCAMPDTIPEGGGGEDGRPRAPLAPRLVALAAAALRAGAVRHMSSDEEDPDGAARPHLLLRAVALPFAPDANDHWSAVVIASWRKLLSADETAALHRELAAAIAWMHDLGRGD